MAAVAMAVGASMAGAWAERAMEMDTTCNLARNFHARSPASWSLARRIRKRRIAKATEDAATCSRSSWEGRWVERAEDWAAPAEEVKAAGTRRSCTD